MESLTGASLDKEKSKPPERVALGLEESQRVEGWLRQVTEFTKGYLALSKSDLVNFLVRQHDELLQAKELQKIRADHYDPVRHITWITPQIKEALAAGDMTRVLELQEELRGVELSAARSEPRKRKAPSGEQELPRKKRKTKPESMQSEAEQTVRMSESHEEENSL